MSQFTLYTYCIFIFEVVYRFLYVTLWYKGNCSNAKKQQQQQQLLCDSYTFPVLLWP